MKERQPINEMSRVCQKSDGYGIIIEIYSNDHGKLGDARSPAHAHVFDTSMKEIGEVVLTYSIPQRTSDITWYRTNGSPSVYTAQVLKWAKDTKHGASNWIFAVRTWESFHPN